MDLEKLTREEREYQVFRKVVDAKSSIDSIYRTISILLDNPKNIEFMSTMSFADLLRDINSFHTYSISRHRQMNGGNNLNPKHIPRHNRSLYHFDSVQ